MGPVVRTAVVTGAWLLVQGFVGALLLGRKGRPYKALIVVLHIVLFFPIAAGWAFTMYGLSTASGNHVWSWIAQIVMGLAVVSLLVDGLILIAGKKVPAPRGSVLRHQFGAAAALLGSLAGIACMLLGV
ncbi:MAG: hypothetical protein ACLQDL_10280 [Spirochaetia bacterium]